MGKKRLLPFSIVICLVIYFFLYEVNQVMTLFKDAGGLWSKDKFRPLVTALSNLGMNIIMVQFWGLYGVILSTVLSMVIIGLPWLFANVFTEMFTKEQMPSLITEILSFAVADIVISSAVYFVCSYINIGGVIEVAIKLVICVVLTNLLLFLVFRRRDEFSQVLSLVNKVTKGKLFKNKQHN
jgi:uncharacterized protein YacL